MGSPVPGVRSRSTLYAFLTLAGSLAVALVLSEAALRVVSPRLSPANLPVEPEMTLGGTIKYETKPFSAFAPRLAAPGTIERTNSEGFRGPELVIPKPKGVTRILAIGDSVVQDNNVAYGDTWEQVVERELASRNAHDGRRRVEILNAGVGGHVSWQAAVRLEQRGLKYQPDLVLVLVGWNDMVYSALASWRSGIDLTAIDQARETKVTTESAGLAQETRFFLYRHSAIARLARSVRNDRWNKNRALQLIATHQRPSGTPFRDDALRLYLFQLDCIRQEVEAHGARMALVLWPTLITRELLDDAVTQQKLLTLYNSFPLSTGETLGWHIRYTTAQRAFAASHPDVVLIDAVTAFDAARGRDRLRLFTDHAHLTVDGDALLGHVVAETIAREQLLP